MGPVMDLSDATGGGGNMQGVDIPDVTLWLIVQLRLGYRREVKACTALTLWGALSTTQSSMKTCVFTPPHETGILVPHILPDARSRDTRLGRGSSGPQAPSEPIVFRPLMVKGLLCALTGRAAFLLHRHSGNGVYAAAGSGDGDPAPWSG
jgi:hypothetical protein